MNQVDVARVNAKLHDFVRLGMNFRLRLLETRALQQVNDVHGAVRIPRVRQLLPVHVKHQGLVLLRAVVGPLPHVHGLVLLRAVDAKSQVAKPLDAAEVRLCHWKFAHVVALKLQAAAADGLLVLGLQAAAADGLVVLGLQAAAADGLVVLGLQAAADLGLQVFW